MRHFGEKKNEWSVSEFGELSERAVTVFKFGSAIAYIKSVDHIDDSWPEDVQEECALQLGWAKCHTKRREVEALYREKNPEWRTDWVDAGAVQIFRNGTMVDVLDAKGRTTDDEIPPHILTQARAKFRENYQLKRDELWFRGMPVKMVFGPDDSDGATDEYSVKAPCTKAVWASWSEGRSCSRDEWCASDGLLAWTDESERLEAHDRMRRFYYEELQLQRLTSLRVTIEPLGDG